MNQYIPTAIINPCSITIYRERVISDPGKYYHEDPPNHNESFINSKRTAEGMISKNAERKMKKAVDYLLYISPERKVYSRVTRRTTNFKIAFVTLTLSSTQCHSDNEIRKKLLNQLLTEFRTVYKVQNYIWKAEKQVNGNIHFHILIDRYIPWYELRTRWNRIQNKLGYVDRYREKMKKRISQEGRQKKIGKPGINKTTDYNNPNSIDIHSLYRIKNIRAYLLKYISKNIKLKPGQKIEEYRHLLVTGRLWGCNQELSNIKGARIPIDAEVEKELKYIIDMRSSAVYVSDYFTTIQISIEKLMKLKLPMILSAFCNYVRESFSFLSPELQAKLGYG